MKLRAPVPGDARQQTASPWQRLGVVSQTDLGGSGWKLVTLPPGTDAREWARSARSLPGVVAAEPNHRYQLLAAVNDPLAPLQYGLRQIGATNAWDSVTGSNGVVVAVLDSGINAAHPDLMPALWRNSAEVAGNGLDDDGNGFVDDLHGADFVDGDGDPADDSGHGSHVAGIVAAAGNNLTGAVGVAHGCRVMSLRILSEDGSATTDRIVEAFEYVRAMKKRGVDVRIINNSWGGEFPSLAIYEAISAAADDGILSVCAAGNDGQNNDAKPYYPTSHPSPGVLAVAAGSPCDAPESFSNFGARSVHLAAPGGDIYNAYLGGESYATLSGTSMAAPHVSGAAALLLSRRPSLTLAQLRALLLSSVDAVPAWSGLTAAAGRLNVAKAVDRLNAGTPLPSTDPTNALPRLPIQLVSRSHTNRAGLDWSYTGSSPRAVSDDGRFVVFLSYATNLVPGDTAANLDVFLRDTWSNTTVRVSQTQAGVGANDDCDSPVISGDGAYVAFASYAGNLVGGDNNQSADIFVWTRSTRALQRISRRPDGTQFDLDSWSPAISGNGGHVVFTAEEPADGGAVFRDVYCWTRSSGAVQMVSLAADGDFPNDWSENPSISADGRYVAFHSWADNIVTGDSNAKLDVFVRDMNSQANERVSLATGGAQGNGDSYYGVISGDGRWVAFSSLASNFAPAPAAGQLQVHLYDRSNDQLALVSRTQQGTAIAATNIVESISGDGRFVLFSSASAALFPGYGPEMNRPFLFDRLTGAVGPLAINAAGIPADEVVASPQITPDGRRVVFSAQANNLVPDDGNNLLDVFLLDRGTNFADLRLRVSGATNWTGLGQIHPHLPQRAAQPLPGSGTAAFDFQVVNAGLVATSFVVRATVPPGWQMTVLAGPGAGTNATAAALQGTLSTGRLALGATNAFALRLARIDATAEAVGAVRIDVRLTGATNELDAVVAAATWTPPPPGLAGAFSRASNGVPALLGIEVPSLSADGLRVAFSSSSANLVSADDNVCADVFVVDRQSGAIRAASANIGGTLGNGPSLYPSLSRDGRHVAFESQADNLVAGDANGRKDILVKDLVGGSIQLASAGANGQQANRGSRRASLGADGRYVLFESIASNLVAGDTNGMVDVFLKDLQTSAIECVSRGPGGEWGGAASTPLQMTPDARFVLFASHASNLGFTDTNRFPDVFLRDRQTGTVELLGTEPGGAAGPDPGLAATMSDDGRHVLLIGEETGPVDTGATRLLLIDRATGQRTALDGDALGLPAGLQPLSARIAPDGRWIAVHAAPACGSAQTNRARQIFLSDRQTGALLPVTRTRDGRSAERDGFATAFAGGGRHLAFVSASERLLGEPGQGADQVFVFDRANLQPDAFVRREQQSVWRGVGVEGATNIVLEQPVPLNAPRTFLLAVTNLSEFGGPVRLTAPTGDGVNWTARYYADSAGGAEITASIAGGWDHDPGASPLELRVRVVVTVLTGNDLPPLTVHVASVPFPFLAERLTLGLAPDSDNDGLPDPWERTTFGDLLTAHPASDFDLDGAGDVAEFYAGTNPKSEASLLSLGAARVVGQTFSLVLSNAQPGRYYTLESTTDLNTGFTPRSPEFKGFGLPLVFQQVMAPAETNLLLRVKAELP